MKQQAHGPVPGVQTTIIDNAVSAVKAFDSEMSSHVLGIILTKARTVKTRFNVSLISCPPIHDP